MILLVLIIAVLAGVFAQALFARGRTPESYNRTTDEDEAFLSEYNAHRDERGE